MRFILIHAMPPQEGGSEDRDNSDERWPFTVSSSAVDGGSGTDRCQGDGEHGRTVCGHERSEEVRLRRRALSLSPVFINDVVACYLVNLAALEAAGASTASSFVSDGYVVSSYLLVLAMLMDGEEDVHLQGLRPAPSPGLQLLLHRRRYRGVHAPEAGEDRCPKVRLQ